MHVFIYLNKVRIWIKHLCKRFMYLKIVNFHTELVLLTRGCLRLVVHTLNIECRLLFPPAPKSIVCCNKHAFHCFRQPEISTNLPDCASILMKLINNQSLEANSISSWFIPDPESIRLPRSKIHFAVFRWLQCRRVDN